MPLRWWNSIGRCTKYSICVCMALILLLVCFLFFSSSVAVAEVSMADEETYGPKLFNVVIVCTFKNEGLLLGEWMQHYIDEGIDHFYLIDHGSTDKYMDVLKKFPPSMITLRHDRTPQRQGLQDELMNKYFGKRVKAQAHWVLVVDVDEYLYPISDNQCLSDMLGALNPEVNRVWLPWKVFGSNGYKDQPKGGVVAGFTKRAETKVEVDNLLIGYGKTLVRVSDTLYLRTHASDVKVKPHFYLSDGRYIDPRSNVTKGIGWIDETVVTRQPLQLNHYMFQSRNYYERHKCARGGGQSGKSYKYTMKYYYDSEPQANSIFDDGLVKRKGVFTPETSTRAQNAVTVAPKCRSKHAKPALKP